MRRIYKYPLQERLGGITIIEAKITAILDVLNQPGTGNCVWCEIDDDIETTRLTIMAFGTGIEFDGEVMDKSDWSYIGTAIDSRGYVWHYYAHGE